MSSDNSTLRDLADLFKGDLADHGKVMAAAVLAVLLVAFSTYGRRLCRHPAVRLLVWGASMVFLPLSSLILSALLSRVKAEQAKRRGDEDAIGGKNPNVKSMWTLLLWIVLIIAIKCNADLAATAVTAAASSSSGDGDVSIDGNRISPQWAILGEYAWLAVLIGLCIPVAGKWLGRFNIAIFIVFSALGPAKLVLKLAAFHRASGSFALGKNARLIAGYMEQVVAGDDGRGDEQVPPVPRYIVMGEKKRHVEESPQGYRVKRDALRDQFSGLVTLDRVWSLAEHGNGILAERVELRDLCLSYSLFKMLRRRLSGYPLADAGSGKALSFVLNGMDSASGSGTVNADRVFRVLVDELWFASDFYYSPIPLCIFGGWCAALNYLCSLLIIVGAVVVGYFYQERGVFAVNQDMSAFEGNQDRGFYKAITYSLLVTVVLVEAWEMVAGVCSNWTKMALLGHYIRHQSTWRRSGCLHAGLAAVLRLRPARRWRDRLGQNSVLEPRRFRSRAGLLSQLLHGSSGLMKSIRVSPLVRDAVLRSLVSSYGGGAGSEDSAAAARRVGGRVDWAVYGSQSQKSCAWDDADGNAAGSSNTEVILVWHVATRLFEMKSTSPSPDMITACHLSYYCAYLVAVAPELLPDSAAWTKKRYKQVSDDVRAALGADGGGGGGGESTAERYERLLAELSKESRDPVLRRGAELGRRLVEEYAEDEASACRILDDFWSEMVLFVAPSEKTKGHVRAMARGGEFITLVWALLLHAGVTTRPDTSGSGGAIP